MAHVLFGLGVLVTIFFALIGVGYVISEVVESLWWWQWHRRNRK